MSEIDDIIREFLVESNEGLDQMDRDLVDLEKDPESRDLLASIFRAIHTIKGTSGVLGFPKLESVAHGGESLLSRMRDGKLRLTPEITSALLAMVDALRSILLQIEKHGQEGDRDCSDVIQAVNSLLTGDPNSGRERLRLGEILVESGVSSDAVAEAVEEQKDGDPRRLGEILVAKGEAKSEVVLEALNRQEDARPASASSSIRVDVGLLDKVMNLVGELVLARNQVLQYTATQKDQGFVSTAQRLNLITTELQEGVMKTRMQPIGNVWNKFPRLVRDLAITCGKQVRIELEGSDTELDKTIIEAIKDPLTHIVRNAVDHGIEAPEARRAKTKSEEGRLLLRAFHEGGQVNIEITDDGAGIDLERVKQKALTQALISNEQLARMSERELTNLIFLPGLSTAQKVTNVSGRGVGMDVVKTNVEKIGGTVDVQSTPGQGTSLKIKIPLTLAIIPALIVTSGGERFAIPQISLLELVRLEGREATRAIERIHGVPVYRLRGNLLPLAFLNAELNCLTDGAGVAKADQQLDFEAARSKHFGWKGRLEAFLRNECDLSEDEAGSHQTCALGKWLYDHALNRYGNIKAIHELEAKHAAFHEIVREIVRSRLGAKDALARKRMSEFEALSHEVVYLLTKVEQVATSRNVVNIVVLQADGRQFGLVVDEINDTEEIVVKPMGKHLKGVSSFAGATIMGDGRVALILDVMGIAQKASVVSEAREMSCSDSSTASVENAASGEQWLVFKAGQQSRMAVPLSVVARLEEISADSVEKAGSHEVVQYRDRIMPLLHMSDLFGLNGGAQERESLQVIVYSEGAKSVGLVVNEILDVVEQNIAVKQNSDRAGLLGSAVIQKHVTDLIDVPALVAAQLGPGYGLSSRTGA